MLFRSIGNVYVNRNMIGAVVGVQPFGGEGLSGTGPKAGGPLYLLRLLAERPADAAMHATSGAGPEGQPPIRDWAAPADEAQARAAAVAFAQWLPSRSDAGLSQVCERLAHVAPARGWRLLAGPTGEANLYALLPREAVLCLAETPNDRLVQLAAVLAIGSCAVWPADARSLFEQLPDAVKDRVLLAKDWSSEEVHFDALLLHGAADRTRAVLEHLNTRPGPIIGLTALVPGDGAVPLERLVIERSLSINTAAAGGNASLMTIG